MTKLRKEKEGEIFCEFQRHQQKMGDLLHNEQLQATTDEDERIAQAVAEQYAKRDVRPCLFQTTFCDNSFVHYIGQRES